MRTETITRHDATSSRVLSNSRTYLHNRKTLRAAPQALKGVSDEALMKELAEGNKSAIRTLFARHSTRVFRFVLHLVREESAAEDIVNEVFVEIWRHPGRFEGRCRLQTWLLAITRNNAIAVLRRRFDAQLDDATALTLEDPSDNPEASIEKKDRSAVLRKCLKQLSPLHREVIDLAYYHEKTIVEVAQIIEVPESTVKTRMFYARNRIAKLLKKEGVDQGW